MKIVFDENFGEPIVAAIKTLVPFCEGSSDVVVQHLFEFAPRGTHDDVWIPKLKTENCIVISNDRGKSNVGRKLPWVCRENGVRHVLISGSLQSKKQYQKMVIVLHHWPEIIAMFTTAPGTWALLAKTAAGHTQLVTH